MYVLLWCARWSLPAASAKKAARVSTATSPRALSEPDAMPFELIDLGASRSVAEGDGLRALHRAEADATLVIGGEPEARARALRKIDVAGKRVVAVELGTE